MNEVEEILLAAIDKADLKEPTRNIKQHRQRLLQEITSRMQLESRRGMLTDKFGATVSVSDVVGNTIDSAYYVGRPETQKAKFVSRWAKPSSEERARISKDVAKVIETMAEINHIVPIDRNAFQKAVNVLSANLVYGFENGKVVFSKLNPNGMTGSKDLEFNDIIPSNLVNQELSGIKKELHTATLREIAKKMLSIDNPKKLLVDEKIEQLRRKEILEKIPQRAMPRVDRKEVHDEFYRRAAILRGLDPASTGGDTANIMRNEAKQEMERLDDLTDVQRELNTIQPEPVQRWEGLPYE